MGKDVKKRFKMYKSGKNWVIAPILFLGLSAGVQSHVDHVHADTVSSTSNTEKQASTQASSIQQSQVVLKSSTASSQAQTDSASSATVSSKEDNQPNIEAAQSSQVESSSTKVSSKTSSSKADAVQADAQKQTDVKAQAANQTQSAAVQNQTKQSKQQDLKQDDQQKDPIAQQTQTKTPMLRLAVQSQNNNNQQQDYNKAPANTHDNGLVKKINQEAQRNAASFNKQLSNAKARNAYNKLNAMGKRLAQAANLNLSNLSQTEIDALNKVYVDGESYDGQLTYSQFEQYGKTLVSEDKQFAIPKFDKSKIKNFPAATTKDAESGKVENLDIWDSWPVVHADNGGVYNWNGYELAIGMMGVTNNWNDGHLYLLYTKYGDTNFDDWKCAGPIFGYNASSQHQQWSGSATVNQDGSIQLYYTDDDLTDGNNHQSLASATVYLKQNNDEITIDHVENQKTLFTGDGYYYQSYQQWKDANDKMDDFCLRDPHVFDLDGKRYLAFEAGTGTYNYQSEDQIYNLRNYGGATIAEDIQDLFSIVNNKDMTHRASLANGCIGLMELGGTEKNPTVAELFAPLVSTPMVSDEVERPVIVKIDDKYYLFTDTRLNRGSNDPLNNEANKKIGDNVGMMGFVSDSLTGGYKPLNGSGVVLTATVPNNDRTSTYSWYAVPMFKNNGDTANYVLITAYMSNRGWAAGNNMDSTWAPSFVVKINPDGTTEVLDNSVTPQQGVWVAPTVTDKSHMAIQAQENPDAVQVKEHGKWYLRNRGNNRNLTGFQYIKDQNKTVYYDSKTGAMVHGQQKINGYWYYFDDVTGAMKFGYQWIGGKQHKEVYYDLVTGAMVYGQQNINGKWQYFDRVTGAQVKNGYVWIGNQHKEVYYDKNGNMVYGQQKINGKWQYFDTVTGAQAKNKYVWIASQYKEVYYDKNGNMVYGQQKINSKWQYFDTVTGAQAKDMYVWIAGQHKEVYYDENGNMVYGQQKIHGKWQYFDTVTGAQAKNKYVWIAGQHKEVFYDKNGNMVYGQQKINGKWQYFDRVTGAQVKNGYVWIADQQKETYYDRLGNMVYGQRKINGKWQYFDKVTGAQAKNKFVKIPKQHKTVFYDANGNMLYGRHQIDGKWYNFDKVTGAVK